jgi:hypothetical protein
MLRSYLASQCLRACWNNPTYLPLGETASGLNPDSHFATLNTFLGRCSNRRAPHRISFRICFFDESEVSEKPVQGPD